jgi:hypothetical protein
MLSVRAEVCRREIPIEVQKLLDLYNDPHVPLEQKAIAKKELDEMIRKLEDRVETNRHLRNQKPS